MLDGLQVVELGDTVASAAAGALCLRLGAEVVKASECPNGASTAGPTNQRDRLLELLDRDKTRVAATADSASGVAARPPRVSDG